MPTPNKKQTSSSQHIRRQVPVAKIPVETLVDDVETDILEDRFVKQSLEDTEKLEDFQGKFGGQQYYVRCERYNEKENEMEIVDKIFFDTFDPYILGKKYGGGRFVCTLLNNKGKYVEGGRFHFNFARTDNAGGQLAVPVDPMQNPSVLMVIESLKSQQAMMMEVLKAAMTGEKQTPIDQLVSALKGLHDMNPKTKDENPLKNFKEFLELQALLSDRDGDKSEGGGVMSDIKEAIKILGESKHMMVPQVRPPQQPRPLRTMGPQNLPIITKQPLEAEPVNELENDPVFKKIAPYIPQLVEAATENAPPEKWAGFLIEVLDTQIVPAIRKKYWNVPSEDEIWDKLIEATEDETKIEKIFEYVPSLADKREWVVAVLTEAVKQFDDAEPPQPASLNGSSDLN